MKRKVYLLHYERPIAHAQHYRGSANDVDARVHAHANGTSGARLPEVFHEQGIPFVLAHVEPGDRNHERKLKKRKNARKECPICKEATA